jgi:hypothetical protein
MLCMSYYPKFFTIKKMSRKVKGLIYISLKKFGYKVSHELERRHLKLDVHHASAFSATFILTRGR